MQESNGHSRLSACFAELKARQRKGLIPYLMAGDPSIQDTVPLMHAMIRAGADVIELGIPFSDPVADGPVIEQAHQRAVAQGVTLDHVFDMVAQFRQTDRVTPVVLMGYLNPLEVLGYDSFAARAEVAGVDGVLIVDAPPERCRELPTALRAHAIAPIFLLAPTTTDQRIARLCAEASGYLYYISLRGVTGAGHLDIDDVRQNLARIRAHTVLPLGVGFGVCDSRSAATLAELADAVIVGTVLVRELHAHNSLEAGQAAMLALLGQMREAMDQSSSSTDAR